MPTATNNSRRTRRQQEEQSQTEEQPQAATSEEQEILVSNADVMKMLQESNVERLHDQMEQGVVNPIVLAKVLDVKPQQIYNRIRSGAIPSSVTSDTQKIVIPLEDAVSFAQKYLNRKALNDARIQRELRGE